MFREGPFELDCEVHEHHPNYVGPRGSGKSALVHMTLKNTPKVINVGLKGYGESFLAEKFAHAILSVSPPETQKGLH